MAGNCSGTSSTLLLPVRTYAGQQVEQQPQDLWTKALEKLPLEQRASITEHAPEHVSSGQAVLNQLLALANEKQDLAAAKAWKLRFSGRNYKLRAVTGNIVTWLTRFQGVADVAVSFDPVHAALPWAAVRFVLQAVTAENEFSSHLLIGIERVSYLVLRGQIYEQLYLQPRTASTFDNREIASEEDYQGFISSLESTLVDLYSEILTFLYYSVSYLGKSTRRRTVHAILHRGALGDYLSRFASLESRTESSVSTCARLVARLESRDLKAQLRKLEDALHAPVIRLGSRVGDLLILAEMEERCQILQWISAVHHETDHYNAREGRLEGTGDWLIARSEYVEWRNSPTSMVFWLHGIPGAGKTKLASKVVDDSQSRLSGVENQGTIAYFYCDANRSSHNTSLAVLRGLVKQLSTPFQDANAKSIIPTVADIYRSKRSCGFPSDGLTVEDCEAILPSLINTYPQVILVVDGLDECDRKDRRAVVGILDDLLASADSLLKIFIASRNDTDLKDHYKGGCHVEICCRDNNDDIKSFVKSKLEQDRWCQKHMRTDVRSQILETFGCKSQGMFQWAAIHIDELLELRDNSDIQAYLHQLPEGLKSAYDRVWQATQTKRGRAPVIAQRAFQWLMCSWEPLSPKLLEVAVSQDPEVGFCPNIDITIEYILDACHNLIKVEREGSDEICRFSHLSVQEYFQEYHWSISEAHSIVGQVCLRVWMSNLYLSERLEWDWAFWREEARFAHLAGPDVVSLIEEDCLKRQKKEDEIERRRVPGVWDGWTSFIRSGAPKSALCQMMAYASGWYNHYVALAGEPEHVAFPQVLHAFLGRPGCSGASYRKWGAWIKGDFEPRFSWRTQSPVSHTHLQPTSAPEFGCAYLGLTAVLRTWLDKGSVDVLESNPEGETLLALASIVGNVPLCHLLLENGAEVNPVPETSSSPLPIAALHGYREVAELLIRYGANVNTSGHFRAPLMEAMVIRDVQFAQLLLDNGADPNVVREREVTNDDERSHIPKREEHLWSPLITAVYYGCVDTVQLLLDRKADINMVVDGSYPTALYAAADGERSLGASLDILRLLIKAGADVHVKGGRHATILGTAICSMEDHRDKVDALLDAGTLYIRSDYIGVTLIDESGQYMDDELDGLVEIYPCRYYCGSDYSESTEDAMALDATEDHESEEDTW